MAGVDAAGEALTLDLARRTFPDAEAFLVAPAARPSRDRDGEAREEAREVDPLTAREIEVLQLVAAGLPNKAIAARLGISDQTVKFHVSAICGKLGAMNRTEAVRTAIERGLVAI